jgi:hypothetical protein
MYWLRDTPESIKGFYHVSWRTFTHEWCWEKAIRIDELLKRMQDGEVRSDSRHESQFEVSHRQFHTKELKPFNEGH